MNDLNVFLKSNKQKNICILKFTDEKSRIRTDKDPYPDP
jgi:hypothetical protein